MFENHPDHLVKKSESDFTLNNTPITAEKFLRGMGKCGFNMDFTRKALCCLKLGGTWHLRLTEKQKKTIFGKPVRSPIGFGQ